jgi:hypothetical protein
VISRASRLLSGNPAAGRALWGSVTEEEWQIGRLWILRARRDLNSPFGLSVSCLFGMVGKCSLVQRRSRGLEFSPCGA